MPVKKISQASESSSKRNHSSDSHRILVVDDDEDLRRLNVEILTSSGYRVDAAADGALALDSLRVNNYDLLLTDYDMPNVNGLSLIKKLRADHKTIPVILVSGTVPTKELSHPWLQIDSTLPKPYTLDQLLSTVRKVLGESDGIAEAA